MAKNASKNANKGANTLSDDALENASGGEIVDRGPFRNYYVVDKSGKKVGEAWSKKKAMDIAAEKGVGNDIINSKTWGKMAESGRWGSEHNSQY